MAESDCGGMVFGGSGSVAMGVFCYLKISPYFS